MGTHSENVLEQKLEKPEKCTVDISAPSIRIVHCPFHSEFRTERLKEDFISGDLFYHELTQEYINENQDFEYSIVLPDEKNSYSSAIVMLHGLNERTWDKYLPWAKYLVQNTGKPVILFPIAYHMNRSPKDWSNPRQMGDISAKRRSLFSLKNSSFFNAAISTRLQYHPEQFIYSGLQSFFDITALAQKITKGEHQYFDENTRVDFFAYSIGAFLAQILFLNNPQKLFSNSKLFLFCGGCTFDKLDGKSKFILDNKAFESLEILMKQSKLNQIKKRLLKHGFEEVKLAWDGLFMMMHENNNRRKREKLFIQMAKQIMAVSLEKDRVINSSGIKSTLQGHKAKIPIALEIIDFPFDYTHENPFPVLDTKQHAYVNRAFSAVFNKAVKFLQ